MKFEKSRLIILSVLLILFKVAVSQTITVDGYAFLEFQEFHDSINVKFERLAPSYLIDSTYTDTNGYYSIEIEPGVYKPSFSKSGYLGIGYIDTPCYQNITLIDQTLVKAGLSGELKGQLSSDTYVVDGNIFVPDNETLTIEAGTILKFKQDVMFEVFGQLIAIGSVNDSITFTRYSEGVNWKGIDFKENSSDQSVLKYCLVEYSDDRGISVYHCSPAISYSKVQRNFHQIVTSTDEEKSGGGAGICLQYSNSNLENIIVKDNTGIGVGIGIYCKKSNTNIKNSIIVNNVNPLAYTLYYPGGGIFCESDVILTIENSVICYNKNSFGGGICIGDDHNGITTDVTIVNSIIYENIVEGDYPRGGGIAAYNEPILKVFNTLFWNNELENISCDDPWIGVMVTVNGNLDSCDAYGNMVLDPKFVSASNNNFSLEPDSPCIDAGINSFVTSEKDFVNCYRIWDGNNDNDSIVDLGAYEIGSIVNPVGISSSSHEDLHEILIYPNPAKDMINIKSDHKIPSIEIYDYYGRLVIVANQTRIDISKLNRGLYVVKILSRDKNYRTGKFLKY
jgi:hypothetical protein